MKIFKEINIKNLTYYFFNDMINIKNLDPNLLNINKILFKPIDAAIYNIEYMTIKSLDHVNIDGINPLYLIFNNEELKDTLKKVVKINTNFCFYRQEQSSIGKIHRTLG